MLDESKVNVAISELIAKEYLEKTKLRPDSYNFIVRNEEIIKLKTKGARYLDRIHPPVFIWWTRILDSLPAGTTLLITIIGLIASVFGILDFADKIYSHVLNK
jgi:hypothetical protein